MSEVKKTKKSTKNEPKESSNVQLFSFEVTPETVDDIELKVLMFPEELKELIYNHPVVVEEMKNYKGDLKNYCPFAKSTMFKLASAIFPSVIHANNRLSQIHSDEGRWIYFMGNLNLNGFQRLLNGWLKKEAEKRGWSYTPSTTPWDFKIETFKLKDCVRLGLPVQYQLIPAYYSYVLSRQPFQFRSLNRCLQFYRSNGAKGASLMTLPFDVPVEEGSYFAYELNCQLVDPIDSPTVCLNVWMEVTRFYDQRPEYQGAKKPLDPTYKKTKLDNSPRTVYVYKKNPRYVNEEIVFNQIKVSKKKTTFEIERTSDEFFLEQMGIELDPLISQPELGLVFDGTVDPTTELDFELIALIGINGNETAETATGVGLPERSEMFQLVRERLSRLTPKAPLVSVEGVNKKGNFTLKGVGSLKGIEQVVLKDVYDWEFNGKEKKLNRYAFKSHHRQVSMGICTDNPEVYQDIVKATRLLLKLTEPMDSNRFKNEAGVEVTFHELTNQFVAQFDKGDVSEKKERFGQISNLIQTQFPRLDMAIIEIPDYHKKESTRLLDTKSLVRAAFQQNQVLTQFVQTNHHQMDVYLSAVQDLLSVSGFRDAVLVDDMGDCVFLGLTSVSTGNRENRYVFSKMENGQLYLKLYPYKEWQLSHELMKGLNQAVYEGSKIKKLLEAKVNFKRWVEDTINETILASTGLIYCYLTTNLRRQGFFPMMRNQDFFELDEWLRQRKLDVIPDERLRWIRLNDEEEVPAYYLYKNSQLDFNQLDGFSGDPKVFGDYKGVNRDKGVFRGSNQTYYLIAGRPDSMQTNKGFTKLMAPTIPLRRQALLEVTIRGHQSESEADQIATLTQNLRKSTLTFNTEVKYPYHLHVSHYVGQYLKAIGENLSVLKS